MPSPTVSYDEVIKINKPQFTVSVSLCLLFWGYGGLGNRESLEYLGQHYYRSDTIPVGQPAVKELISLKAHDTNPFDFMPNPL